MNIYFFVFIGTVFGILAGCTAFLITWNEWQKHKLTGAELWKQSLPVGILAFVFFFCLAIFIGFLSTKYL